MCRKRIRAFLAAGAIGAALGSSSCDGQVPLTVTDGAIFNIDANPRSIPLNGGVSTITILAFKSAEDGGGTVPDGTQFFLTTTIGVIEERVATENGIARASLRSDGRAGTATVTARSGPGDGVTVDVDVGRGETINIRLTANPATLGPQDTSSLIVATVTDDFGNPLAGIPLVFRTTNGSMASRGSVLTTDNAGQASDRLFLPESEEDASVTAVSGSVESEAVTVDRGNDLEVIIDSVSPATGRRGTQLDVTITGQNFQPGATVSFGSGVAINEVVFVNAETLVVDISIDGRAEIGSRDVRVTNPDGGSFSASGFFEVQPASP
jgi:hypothetical protein